MASFTLYKYLIGVYNGNTQYTHMGYIARNEEEPMEQEKNAFKPEKAQCHCRKKHTPRSEEAQRQLQNRLNRMIGQLNGMKKMLDENRYCGDILIQLAAVERALQSFGYIILKDHMETCVVEGVKNGDLAVVDEAVELMKKLK